MTKAGQKHCRSKTLPVKNIGTQKHWHSKTLPLKPIVITIIKLVLSQNRVFDFEIILTLDELVQNQTPK